MPRLARAVAPNLPHNLVLRANNRRRLFSFPRDYLLFLALVRRAARKTGCLVHVYCLMTNHVHLVVTPPCTEALAAFVKDFAQRYASRRNRARDGSGKLFEQRFYSEPIETEAGLAACTAYVELNAYRAGLARDAASYRWSSYAFHALGRHPHGAEGLLTASPWFLGLGKDERGRAAGYVEFVQGVLAADANQPPSRSPPPRRSSKKRLRRPNGSRAT